MFLKINNISLKVHNFPSSLDPKALLEMCSTMHQVQISILSRLKIVRVPYDFASDCKLDPKCLRFVRNLNLAMFLNIP